jgi:hypothetical protein
VAKNTYVLTGSAYRELPSGGVGEEGKQCGAKTRARDGAALEGPGQQTETAGGVGQAPQPLHTTCFFAFTGGVQPLPA